MTIAVTGPSGFLGNALLPLLEKAGHKIIRVDRRNGYNITDWKNIQSLNGFDTIIHMAAQSYVPDAYADPRAFYDTNVNGTLNMLELARLNKARFIFISSYVYGHPDYMPIDEKHPVRAVNPYGESKVIAESLCSAYHRDFALNVTIFRPFNIYGHGQPAHFLIPKIIQQITEGQKVELFDPRPKRDYIYVDDVAAALLAGVEKSLDGVNIFNIGSGKSHSIPDVIELVEGIVNRKVEVIYLNKFRPDDIMDTICDNSHAKELLNWEPTITLAAGLKEMVEQYK